MATIPAEKWRALRRLVANGVKLASWPREVMAAFQRATTEVLEENAAKDAGFKKVYAAWKTFRDNEHLWFAVNDGAAESFVYANRPKA
jgi:TRAP-type mannitol/chloroaromatic compound transport system substrate-binding protein